MKCKCNISGIVWNAEYMSASCTMPHPFFSIGMNKIPALLSLFQQGSLGQEETHLLYCRMMLDTEHVTFHSPLSLTEELAQIENAQMLALAKIAYSGCFQKTSIDLPHYLVSLETQDISQIISIWEEELEQYRISYMIVKQKHEIRAMLARVQRAFATPLMTSRKKIIINWMLKCCELPKFIMTHPISRNQVSCQDYWIELLGKAIDNDPMLAYPEKDIVEFKEHLEEHLPLNYAQEFSLLEELRDAIKRKQNYFGYSFVDADDRSYAVENVKPQLKRADFANITDFLNAIKASRIHPASPKSQTK